MKKKISVFALLLSLLLAVLAQAQLPVPVKAANSTETTADDVKYRDIEDFMHGMGYLDFTMTDDSIGFVFLNGDFLEVFEYCGFNDYRPYFCKQKDDNVMFFLSTISSNASSVVINYYRYYNPQEAAVQNYFTPILQSTSPSNSGKCSDQYVYYFGSKLFTYYYLHYIENLLYCDIDVFESENIGTSTRKFEQNFDVILFESSLEKNYSFPSWCQAAGLNCLASSNESPTKIPYSYNSYWHIVRKSSSGNWLLTTIGSTLGQSKMNLRLSDSGDLIIYEFSGDDSFTISVRQYIYDIDGWLVRTYDTYDYDDFSSGFLTLPAGSGLDDTRVLAYTSTDIYSSDGLSVYAAASTEYVEPTSPDVTPEPTTAPDSGSSGGGRPGSGTRPSVGGEASGGGGLDFIINLFTLIWIKICSVPMLVDGYSISLQQIFVYGALVSIVGGFIIKFIFRR